MMYSFSLFPRDKIASCVPCIPIIWSSSTPTSLSGDGVVPARPPSFLLLLLATLASQSAVQLSSRDSCAQSLASWLLIFLGSAFFNGYNTHVPQSLEKRLVTKIFKTACPKNALFYPHLWLMVQRDWILCSVFFIQHVGDTTPGHHPPPRVAIERIQVLVSIYVTQFLFYLFVCLISESL